MLNLASYETVDFEVFRKPNEQLVTAASRIGRAAWTRAEEAKPKEQRRSEAELAYMFDRDRIANEMDKAARVGKFAGVIATASDLETWAEVGVLWGKDEVSGLAPLRELKRKFMPQKNYSSITQIAVQHPYDYQGIGRGMAREFFGQFPPDHRPTGYVFEENAAVLAIANRYGFVADPPAPTRVEEKYFGPGSDPVMQYRMVGESNAALLRVLGSPIPPGMQS